MTGDKSSRKLLRTARLDNSDEEIFELPADAGEWAIPGSFEFLDDDESSLTGRRLQAFQGGFLGLTSFGRSTLVAIASASGNQIQQAIEQLAGHLLERYGAPDMAGARRAARSELEYAESLCEYDVGTLIAVERTLSEDGIAERFKRFIPSQTADWEDAKPISLSDLVKQDDL